MKAAISRPVWKPSRPDTRSGPSQDGKLVYHRRLEINETTLPPDRYDAFRTFLSRVAQG